MILNAYQKGHQRLFISQKRNYYYNLTFFFIKLALKSVTYIAYTVPLLFYQRLHLLLLHYT